MEISSIFWLPHITDWWRQDKEPPFKYADLSNVAPNVFSILPHGIGVECSFSIGRGIVGWRQSETAHVSLCERVFVERFAQANNGTMEGADPTLDLTNTEHFLEMKREVEDTKLHRMAKVHNMLEMWQGSQILCATQKKTHSEMKQLTSVRMFPDTEQIFEAF